MELKEIKKNIIDKLPKIIEYSIGNFGQLSSFDKFKDIQNILGRMNVLWGTGLLFSETKEEFLEGNSSEVFEKNFILLDVLNGDIDELFELVELRFSPTLEIRNIENSLNNLNKENVVISELPNIVKVDSSEG